MTATGLCDARLIAMASVSYYRMTASWGAKTALHLFQTNLFVVDLTHSFFGHGLHTGMQACLVLAVNLIIDTPECRIHKETFQSEGECKLTSRSGMCTLARLKRKTSQKIFQQHRARAELPQCPSAVMGAMHATFVYLGVAHI